MANAEDVLREIEQKAMKAAETRDSLVRFAEMIAAYYKQLVERSVPAEVAGTLTLNMQFLLASAGTKMAQQQEKTRSEDR